ncbi:Tm-1-like ATP-binding domain-containing protein [Altericroceibacterium endophyticum]|nr:Tm-1-like ATP-binding domain-containing protein [Altericroceibacterium endophyticum]
MSKPKVMMVVTNDSKQQEAAFLRKALEADGCEVIHLDCSIRCYVEGAEITPMAVAEAGGHTIEEVRAFGHEGKCQAVMIEGATKLAVRTHEVQGLSGIIAVGGSMGTGLAGFVMQALPYGLPKLIVSTMASGFVAPYIGVKDIAIMNSVTDISGLNTIARDVYRNAANAIAGMAKGYSPEVSSGKPLVLMTMLSTTEVTVRALREALEADGCEVMVFHSSGAGGPTLDSIAADKDVALVLDLSVTEIGDHLQNGLANGGPDRGKAGLAKGVPTIFAPGNADFVIAGPLEEAEKAFPGKRYHKHNPALTAVRNELPELKQLADHLAGMFAEANGPVSFFVPLGGFSNHDSPEGHIHDPDMPKPFADYARSVMPGNVDLHVEDAHFNDEVFASAILAKAREYLKT